MAFCVGANLLDQLNAALPAMKLPEDCVWTQSTYGSTSFSLKKRGEKGRLLAVSQETAQSVGDFFNSYKDEVSFEMMPFINKGGFFCSLQAKKQPHRLGTALTELARKANRRGLVSFIRHGLGGLVLGLA